MPLVYIYLVRISRRTIFVVGNFNGFCFSGKQIYLFYGVTSSYPTYIITREHFCNLPFKGDYADSGVADLLDLMNFTDNHGRKIIYSGQNKNVEIKSFGCFSIFCGKKHLALKTNFNRMQYRRLILMACPLWNPNPFGP